MANLSVDQLRDVLRTHKQKLLTLPNVIGVDVGYVYVDGEPSQEVAIRLYVRSLAEADVKVLPSEIDGGRVFVHEVGDIKPQLDVSDREPVTATDLPSGTVGGTSAGPCLADYTGTLGVVLQNASGDSVALSCFHVFGDYKLWGIGDPMTSPALEDGGQCPRTSFGTLQKVCVPGQPGYDKVDAAYASAKAGIVSWIRKLGPVKGVTEPIIGQLLTKMSRTTHDSDGSVTGVDGSLNIQYPWGPVTFDNVVSIRCLVKATQGGDSGCVWIDKAGRGIVGLHFAGEPSKFEAYAHKFSAVQTALGLTVPKASVFGQFNVGTNTIWMMPWVTDDGWIFFRGTIDNKLWKVRIDGTEQTFLNNWTLASPFAGAGDGWVYFKGTDAVLWKVDFNGNNRTQLGVTGDTPWVRDGWVYFMGAGSTLTAVKTDGTESHTINNIVLGSAPFAAADGWLYLHGGDGTLWKVRPDGSGQQQLDKNTTSATPWVPGDGWVYFKGPEDKLLKVNTDGTRTMFLNSRTAYPPFATDDGWVYFVGKDSGLWKVATSGRYLKRVNNNTASFTPFVTSIGVYFSGTDVIPQLWCCPR